MLISTNLARVSLDVERIRDELRALQGVVAAQQPTSSSTSPPPLPLLPLTTSPTLSGAFSHSSTPPIVVTSSSPVPGGRCPRPFSPLSALLPLPAFSHSTGQASIRIVAETCSVRPKNGLHGHSRSAALVWSVPLLGWGLHVPVPELGPALPGSCFACTYAPIPPPLSPPWMTQLVVPTTCSCCSPAGLLTLSSMCGTNFMLVSQVLGKSLPRGEALPDV